MEGLRAVKHHHFVAIQELPPDLFIRRPSRSNTERLPEHPTRPRPAMRSVLGKRPRQEITPRVHDIGRTGQILSAADQRAVQVEQDHPPLGPNGRNRRQIGRRQASK